MDNPEATAQGPADSAGVLKRHPRASAKVMKSREDAALQIMSAKGRVDVYTLAEDLNLTEPQALTVIFNLRKQGKVERAGRQNRRIMFKLTEPEAPAAAAEPTPLPPATIPLHLGQQLEVTEIHLTEDGLKAEVRTNNHKYLLALVS